MRGFRERRSVHDALAVLETRVDSLEAERVPLVASSGRVAADDVAARVDVPHFARSAMDGFALVGEATFGASATAPVELHIVGDSFPGRPFAGAIERTEAVRITTGAPVPEGADAVLMAEGADEVDREGARILRAREPVAPGKHIGAIGEDVRAGDRVVSRGRRLRPQDLGVLAATGVSEVLAVRRPRVRILITGDELLAPGSVPEGPFIVDANSLMLEALALRDGAASVAILRVADRRNLLRDALDEAREEVVLISGGSSVGPEDHAPSVLAELGEVAVHGVALRPASPAGFGFFGEGRTQLAFLLPGNPVSCLCAYEFFAGPSIRALGGLRRAWPHERRRARMGAKIASELGRTDYVRVRLDGDTVIPVMTSGASILSSTTRADGVVIIGEREEGVGEGAMVEVVMY